MHALIGVLFASIGGKRLRAEGGELRADLHDPGEFTNVLIKASLICMLVCALISFPFYSLPTIIVLGFYLAVLSSFERNYSTINLKYRLTVKPILIKASAIMFLMISASLIFLVRQQYRSQVEFNGAVALYHRGDYASACHSFSENYSQMKYSGTYLQFYGKALNMNEEYTQSAEVLERARLYTSDEILYTTIGDNYKSLEAYVKAEIAYQQASFMVPHKLYPQYLLVILYYETGLDRMATSLAEKVIGKNIKVESTATKEIIEAMKKLIKKLKNEHCYLQLISTAYD